MFYMKKLLKWNNADNGLLQFKPLGHQTLLFISRMETLGTNRKFRFYSFEIEKIVVLKGAVSGKLS